MRQHRNRERLGLACTHFRSIFCLPSTIRRRIYLEAGLVNDSDIDLNRWPESNVCSLTDEIRFSYNLLLTCHTIHTEASFILYSTNRFFIRYKDSRSLRLLRNLTQNALSSLVHLRVHLNITSCESGQRCCSSKKYPRIARCYHRHDKPLVCTLRTQNIIREWQSTASHILAHIKPSNLRLHLCCDADPETAMQVVEPLLSTRTLASCSIRLSQQPDRFLQDLAYRTAIQAMGYQSHRSESPFRFLDLPPEIRNQILGYTDLVTPLCDVEWNPRDGFYLRYSTQRCDGSTYCPPHLHHACQFRNCWSFSNSACFCQRSHAAFSSQCRCWSTPTSLFLVCRALLVDAQAVFFGKNRFVIAASAGSIRPAKSTLINLESSIFMMKVMSSSALHGLRFLEIVIPLFNENHLRSHESAQLDCLKTIGCVRGQLCHLSLTIRFYIRRDSFPDSASPNENWLTTALETYEPILGPISKLGGLKRFFVRIALPFTSTQLAQLHRQGADGVIETLEQSNRKIEQYVERLVMGSDYDSGSLQNGKPENSQWMEDFLKSIKSACLIEPKFTIDPQHSQIQLLGLARSKAKTAWNARQRMGYYFIVLHLAAILDGKFAVEKREK